MAPTRTDPEHHHPSLAPRRGTGRQSAPRQQGELIVPAKSADGQSASELFRQVGGTSGIGAAVEEFHRRILADESLASTFAGIDLVALQEKHVAFIGYILGGSGPQPIGGRTLHEAHQQYQISTEQFAAITAHLIGSFVGDEDSLALAPELKRRLEWLQAHIVSEEKG